MVYDRPWPKGNRGFISRVSYHLYPTYTSSLYRERPLSERKLRAAGLSCRRRGIVSGSFPALRMNSQQSLHPTF